VRRMALAEPVSTIAVFRSLVATNDPQRILALRQTLEQNGVEPHIQIGPGEKEAVPGGSPCPHEPDYRRTESRERFKRSGGGV
jgi:hypothetical protein